MPLQISKEIELNELDLLIKNAYPDYEHSKFDENELLFMRQMRAKEIQLMKFVREIVFYAAFIWILLVVSYSNKDINSYGYQKSISGILRSIGNTNISEVILKLRLKRRRDKA